MKKILFVCGSPPHPIHEEFARSIDADFFYLPENPAGRVKALFKIKRNYDTYLSEGLFGYLYLLKLFRIIPKRAKTINLFSDPRLYQLNEGVKFNFRRGSAGKYPAAKRNFQINAIKSLDGAICIGKFQASLLKNLAKIPSITVEPFIPDNNLSKFSSGLKDNNILFIGAGPDYYYKGLDLLVKVFGNVRRKHPESKLYVIGSGWENFKRKVSDKNAVFLGRVSSTQIKRYMNRSAIYCHLGRGEAFGISILEAMTAGIPCVVSDKTGAKESVGRVSKRFVLPLDNEEKITKTIVDYLRMPVGERIKLGRQFKKQALGYNRKKSINLFKREISRLLSEIYRGD